MVKIADFVDGLSRWLLHAHRAETPNSATPCFVLTLPDCVLELVADTRLGLRDSLSLCCTCRAIHLVLAASCSERKGRHYERVLRHFPVHVIGAVPMSILLDLEWIEFDPRWMGSTGYVDRVRVSDLPGRPFRCSRDAHGRLMLLMRRETDVAVLFQRYADSNAIWVFASRTLPIGGCRLDESMVARMALWLTSRERVPFDRDRGVALPCWSGHDHM